MNEDDYRELLNRLGESVPERAVPTDRLLAAANRAHRRRRRLRVGMAVAVTIVAVGAGAAALGSSQATRAHDPVADRPSDPHTSSVSECPGVKRAPEGPTPLAQEPPYPTNAHGQTYGSNAGVQNPADGPELVAVVGDCGKAGFVYADDLDGPVPTSPTEALRMQEQNRERPPVLLVYQRDGRTEIDTFTVSTGTIGMRVAVPSHCGVQSLWTKGQLWLADPPLGDHNPPPGWDENQTAGILIVTGPERAEFYGDEGQRATFRRAEVGTQDPNAGCE